MSYSYRYVILSRAEAFYQNLLSTELNLINVQVFTYPECTAQISVIMSVEFISFVATALCLQFIVLDHDAGRDTRFVTTKLTKLTN